MLIRTWFYLPFLLLFSILSFAQTMVPEFGASITSGCAPLVVTFRDLTTGSPKYWNWDFGNGTLASVQNPTVVYSQPGTYTVTMVVRNADGTNGITKTNYITVNPSPGAGFTSDYTTGCVPVTIQFTDQSNPAGGSITTWQWDFGDGSGSNQQHPTKTYDKEGFYNVSLTVTSNTGCKSTSTRSRLIRIVSGVKAEFDFSKTSSCRPPYDIKFSNLTSGPGNMTFQWNFGNGGTSAAVHPTTTYSTDGTYNVTLTATSEFGCTGTITKPLTLNGPTTNIIVPDSACQTQKVFFRNGSSTQPEKVAWSFGDGDVWPKVSSNMDDSTVYYTPGEYVVKLVNTYATCVDSAIKKIYVRRSPDIDFSVSNATACKAPLMVTFQDATPADPIMDWKWNFGDGSPQGTGSPVNHTYNAAGDYNVSVTFTDIHGCEGKISKPAIVKIEKPTVKITNVPAGGCVPYTLSTAADVQAIDGVASYQWNFGDGGTATGPNPSHTYTSPGRYTVSVTITTNGGCTETATVPNAVLAGTPPLVNFSLSANDVCASDAVQFTDQTTPVGQLNKWEWNFGDGTISNEQHPLHNFQDTGTFTVILTAFNNGCPATSVGQTVKVRPPIAKFRHDVACGASQVTFDNQSIIDPAQPATYYWDFGDGYNSTDEDPVHVYAALGKYNVTLTVTNGSCQSTITNEINLVRELADFRVARDPACRNAPVTITATNNPSNIAAYRWAFDGSGYAPGKKDTAVVFTTNGTHAISLQITDVNGCTDIKNGTINVTGPDADFVANSAGGCKDATVSFTDRTSPTAPLTQWSFDFGDGQSQSFTRAPFAHRYADTGAFIVKLTVRDNMGCTDTATLSNIISIAQLRTDFTVNYDTVCPTSAVQFTDASEGQGLSHTWYFGDGATSTAQNPTHIYGGTETSYTVKLVIRDRGGCQDSLTRNRYITTVIPKPAFDIEDTTTICPPIETKFTFRGADYESWYWDFGDGATSTLVNPTHFYNTYGDFEAKLVLVGYGGCLQSASKMVHVYNPNSGTTWSYSPTYACNELMVDFSISTPPNTSFTFYYGDGTFDTSKATQFQHFYKSPAFYNPSLLLHDAQDCLVGVGGPTTIRVIGAEPFFGLDRKKFCDSGAVYFTNYTIGNDPVVNRVWNFGDGSATSAEEHPTHYYQQPGTFLASQSVTTQAGCSKTITDTIRVYRTPDPIIDGDSIACLNKPYNFKGLLVVPDTSITWAWSLGNATHLSTQNISLTFDNPGAYTLYLQVTNLLGCTDSTNKKLFVPPTPEITVQEDPVIPVSTGVTLPVTYGEGIATYTWTPDKNLSCTDCPTPYANPQFTTTYNIRVADIYGCTNTKDLTVTVVCNGMNYWLPNTFSPNGDGKNDVFAPRGVGLTRINNMKIFNRWGELVFQKMNFLANDRSPSGGWDGTYKGKPAPPDVYIYIIEFVCENAAIVPVKGNVALIR